MLPRCFGNGQLQAGWPKRHACIQGLCSNSVRCAMLTASSMKCRGNTKRQCAPPGQRTNGAGYLQKAQCRSNCWQSSLITHGALGCPGSVCGRPGSVKAHAAGKARQRQPRQSQGVESMWQVMVLVVVLGCLVAWTAASASPSLSPGPADGAGRAAPEVPVLTHLLVPWSTRAPGFSGRAWH